MVFSRGLFFSFYMHGLLYSLFSSLLISSSMVKVMKGLPWRIGVDAIKKITKTMRKKIMRKEKKTFWKKRR